MKRLMLFACLEDVIRESISAAGFDGAVTMRLIDVEKEKIY